MRIGILAVQGAFVEHGKKLERLGVRYTELRQKSDLGQEIDGLILPGGESTVQGKLLLEQDMLAALKTKIQRGMPVLATCAGLILLAEKISNDAHVYFGTMPVTVKRNAYGRQLGSFHTIQEMKGLGAVPMTFIRAPYIEAVGEDVEVLAKVDEKIVAVRYGRQYGLAFHPELDADDRIHRSFLQECADGIDLYRPFDDPIYI